MSGTQNIRRKIFLESIHVSKCSNEDFYELTSLGLDEKMMKRKHIARQTNVGGMKKYLQLRNIQTMKWMFFRVIIAVIILIICNWRSSLD